MYDIVFCCIFYHNPYRIKQWIDYHIELGVDHFCVFYHGDLNFLMKRFPSEYKYLKQKERQNKVTLIEWNVGTWLLDEDGDLGSSPTRGFDFAKPAMMYYGGCLFGDKTQWIANFDIDEFLILNKHGNIKEYLNEFKTSFSIGFSSNICRLKGIQIQAFDDSYLFEDDRFDRNKIHTNDIFNHRPIRFELDDFLKYDTIIYHGDGQRSAPKYFYRPSNLVGMNDHSCMHRVDIEDITPEKNDYATIFHYKYENLWGIRNMIRDVYWTEEDEKEYGNLKRREDEFKTFWESNSTDELPEHCEVDNRIRRLL